MTSNTVLQLLTITIIFGPYCSNSILFRPVPPRIEAIYEKEVLKWISLIKTGKEDEGVAASLTIPQLISKNGYVNEIHHVITEDGYILELHRILPSFEKCGESENKGPVLLQHGLLCDSSTWLVNGVNQSLGYLLSDECYDVWLGNVRGNTYSRQHVSLSPFWDRKKFWDFSFHEMGIYDLPASIDYILTKTKSNSTFYVGHSMGTTAFFIMMSERPEYNEKIRLMSALSPVAYLTNVRTPPAVLIPFMRVIDRLLHRFKAYEIMPSTLLVKVIGMTACSEGGVLRELCNFMVLISAGTNPGEISPDFLQNMLRTIPSGMSAKTLFHYCQIILSGIFGQYDYYSKDKNMAVYDRRYPKAYNLSRVASPVIAFWADNDWFAGREDVAYTLSYLQNVREVFEIEDKNFGHMDFVFGKHQVELVHRHVISLMNSYTDGHDK